MVFEPAVFLNLSCLFYLFQNNMTTTTNTFQVPLLDRGDDQGLPMDLAAYNKATMQVKHLVATNQASTAMLVCDQAGYIRTLGDVELKTTLSSPTPSSTSAMRSFLPARVGKELFKHFIVVAPCSDLHSGAISGETLPDPVLANAIPGAHVLNRRPAHEARGWQEGGGLDRGAQQRAWGPGRHETHYGADAKKWVQSVAHASANQQAIGSVWGRLKNAQGNALQRCLGDDFDKFDVWTCGA